jgi:hypothetical protein
VWWRSTCVVESGSAQRCLLLLRMANTRQSHADNGASLFHNFAALYKMVSPILLCSGVLEQCEARIVGCEFALPLYARSLCAFTMQLTTESCAHTKAFTPANSLLLTTSGKTWESKCKGLQYHARKVLLRNIVQTFTSRRIADSDAMAVHYSRPLNKRDSKAGTSSSQAPQLPAMHPVSPIIVGEPVRGRRLSRTPAAGSSSRYTDTAETALPPVYQSNSDLYSHAQSSDFGARSEDADSVPRSSYDTYRGSSSISSAHYLQVPSPIKRARYYSHALSTEDKDALAHGDHNHNLKPYTPKDVVMHHESRKELLPQGNGTDKLHKMEALAHIEQDKQYSQQAMDKKKVRRSSLLPVLRLTNEHGKDDHVAYHPQASQSMYDLRTFNPAAPQLHMDASVSSVQPPMSRKFSFDEPPPAQSSHVRATSTGDYFTHRTSAHPGLLTPPSSNASPSRMRSPLAPPTGHQRNPSATFDAFLVPHKSGKGEAFRGASNAKKEKAFKLSPSTSEQARTPVAQALRRFSKMPSMPSIKNRKSRRDLQQDMEEDDDVPPVPSLPEASSSSFRVLSASRRS